MKRLSCDKGVTGGKEVELTPRFQEEFPSNDWSRTSLDRLITNTDDDYRLTELLVAVVEGQ